MSVGDLADEASLGASGYVGYEMWVRSLETMVGSIVGASGCFYAIRRTLHANLVPAARSRDFASALTAREHGLRAVSVDEAVCLVPRATSLRREYTRKIRTMARGLETLWFKRHLLNPVRHGRFAWMLASHKLARWLIFLAVPPAVVALVALSFDSVIAAGLLGVAIIGMALGLLALVVPQGKPVPRVARLCGFVLARRSWRSSSCGASCTAWSRAGRRARASGSCRWRGRSERPSG